MDMDKKFTGFIPLLREFQDSLLWKEKRIFSKAEAWIDLLYSARYGKTPEKILDRGELIIINRGDILSSILTLANKWNWSQGKVKHFLKILETTSLISANIIKNRRTIIKILNYGSLLDFLQDSKTDKSRTELIAKKEENNNKLRDKNNSNNEKKDNTTNSVEETKRKELIKQFLEKTTNWAYKRAAIIPSCSRDSFKNAVSIAIDKFGFRKVYKCFEFEDNAIQFLTNIKKL